MNPPSEAQPTRSDEPLAGRRVLVVGAGGLGAPAAAYLATAGPATLAVIDSDRIELSNLHRQLLHRTEDVGRAKVGSVRRRLAPLAAGTTIEAIEERLDKRNAERLLGRYDFIIDGSDNFDTKFLVNDVAVALGVPFSHAGVVGWFGQTMTIQPGSSACCRCLFTEPPPEGEIPTCQEAGIVGPVAGALGMIQAQQAIAFWSARKQLLLNRLLTYDALRLRWRTVHIGQNLSCPIRCASVATGHHPEGAQEGSRRA